MVRRYVEHVAGHLRVWTSESQHLGRQPQRKYQEHDTEEPPDQQRACDVQEGYREADEHEGDQDEPDDHLARSLPGDPHRRLLLQPSPRATARAGGGVGAHRVARIAPRRPSWAALLVGADRGDHRVGRIPAGAELWLLGSWRVPARLHAGDVAVALLLRPGREHTGYELAASAVDLAVAFAGVSILLRGALPLCRRRAGSSYTHRVPASPQRSGSSPCAPPRVKVGHLQQGLSPNFPPSPACPYTVRPACPKNSCGPCPERR